MFKNIIHSFLLLLTATSFAQEGIKPLTANINYLYGDLKVVSNENTSIQQNKAASLTLPFLDDFSYSPTKSYPNQSLWSDSSTYINSGFGIAPLSIGVATFDGLNKRGYPYTPNLANMSSSLPADTLTSKAINLAPFSSPVVDTSLALSFYYQARGNGDNPEITDSLLVDCYKPLEGKWKTEWFKRGNSSPNTLDTMFKRAFIQVKDTAYLHDGFKFRFRNKATTAGDFDHWHVDYVYFNNNRNSFLDTTYNDYSIGYIPSPYLKNYSSMPWRQYDTADRAYKNTVFIRNNGTNIGTLNYSNNTYDKTNTFVNNYIGGSFPSLGVFDTAGWLNHAPMTNPTYNYTFAPMTNTQEYTIKHYIFRTSPDFISQNDTVLQKQTFSNYYAFDDGSAEGGYYVNGVGGKMATKYTLRVSDTLRAVRIYFDPVGSITLSQSYYFRINIWLPGTSGPGLVLYRDSVKNPAYYSNGTFNKFSEYALTTPLILSPGTYYIGMQQQVATGIVVGFDKNIDHSSSLYYDSGNGWTQSSIRGSIMMRPVFGSELPVGLKENLTSKNNLFSIYPNPASDQFMIRSEQIDNASYTLVNTMGQTVIENKIESQQQSVTTENLSNGIYFLILKVKGQLVQQNKIIIQH
ncbi:MAG: T9SS type A sorting domain-containing protein [Bacteroidia bacterium]|nr:T9SS type A sorting domain-containing protein [Bacteroidia bacterium]